MINLCHARWNDPSKKKKKREKMCSTVGGEMHTWDGAPCCATRRKTTKEG